MGLSVEIVGFLRAIGGDVLQETSGTIADQVRLFRLRNQLSILRKAEQAARDAGISPKRISTKLLVPLIESASLEEDASLQELWARLLLRAATDDRFSLHAITLDVLKGISPLEALMMKALHDRLQESEKIAPLQLEELLRQLVVARPDLPWLELEAFQGSLSLPKEHVQVALDNLRRFNLFSIDPQTNWDGKRTGRHMIVMTRLGCEVLDLLMSAS